MKSLHSFSRMFFTLLILIPVATIGLIGYFWISNEFGRFKSESTTLRKEFIGLQKLLIKNETEKVIDYIEFKKSQANERLRQTIESRAKEAHTVATNLFREHRADKTSAEIEKIIRDALGPIRFNRNRGYFFAVRLDGMAVFGADRPEAVAPGPSSERDRSVVQDMIGIIRKQGEGFYQYAWTKPDAGGNDHPKIVYIIHFEPLNWLIGTGAYLDDVVLDIQQEVLERIEKIRFGDNGYVFVGQWDGLSLCGPAAGQNMIDATDRNGVKVVQELILTARAGGGYVAYIMPEVDGGEPYPKLSYTRGFGDWQWYVGAGVDTGKVETVIAQRRVALEVRVRDHIWKIVWILAALLAVIFFAAKFLSDRTRRSFELLTSFFLKAATDSAKIDQKDLHFAEFRQLAISANQMIAQRSQAEQAFRESERQVRLLLNSTAEAIYGLDMEGYCTFANPACLRLLGYAGADALIGKNMHHLIHHTRADGTPHPLEDCRIHGAARTESGTHSISEIFWRADGTHFPVEFWSHPIYRDEEAIGAVVTFLDITDRKRADEDRQRLEVQLQQAQKMEAIGTLAGGIAHDFNNILSAIIGYSEITQLNVSEDNPARRSIDQVLKAGYRARDLVKQILAFSRQGDLEQKPVQIQYVVKEALKLLRATLPTTIEIRQMISTASGSILADMTQIHQVLMNLCTNAHHAMQETGGVLEVAVEVFDLDGNHPALPDLSPGPYVVMSVKDSGHGMDPTTRERIFDPYFTTKEKGVGTGMGLAVVHGIVKRHGGVIKVESEPGKGSCFRVFFPRIQEEMIHEKEVLNLPPGGNERVLFVDDEKDLVELGQLMLDKLGYRVTTMTRPEDALERFRRNPNQYDLVITDQTMPKLTGDKLALGLMAIRPDVPVILCTGFSERITEESANAMGIKGYVMKPIILRNLATIIRRVLDGACSPFPIPD